MALLHKWWVYVIILLIAVAVIAFIMTRPLHAQTPQGPQLSPDVQNLINQIHATGCQAEEIASAQTIDALRKENAQLKAQIEKLDPPRSGATKH